MKCHRCEIDQAEHQERGGKMLQDTATERIYCDSCAWALCAILHNAPPKIVEGPGPLAGLK